MPQEPNPQENNPDELEKKLEKSKEYSVKDGFFYAIMNGFGVFFITPFAIRLGATLGDVGFLQTFPQLLGSLAQLGYSKIARLEKSRKEIVLKFVAFQTILWLGFIALTLYTGAGLFAWLVLLYSLFILSDLLANPAWISWMGDIVKEKERASFFGRRNEVTCFAVFVSTIAAGWVLGFFEGRWGGLYGFTALFAVAFVTRLVSLWYLSRKIEPKLEQPPAHGGFKQFLTQINTTNFGALVVYETALLFAVSIAGPYFAVRMLQDLHFDYFTFGILTASMQIALFLTMVYWSDTINKLGNKNVLYASGLLVAATPIPWMIITSPALLIFAEIISGVGWAGQRIATLNLILKTTPAEEKARFVAYYNFFQGMAVFLGAMTGAFLAGVFQNTGFFLAGLPAVFAISAVLRFAAVAFLAPRIKEEESKGFESKTFLLKTVTVYPMRSAMLELQWGVKKGLSKAFELEKEFVEMSHKAEETMNKLKIKKIEF